MLIDWWFVRDIRFVVVPSLLDDEKRPARSADRSRRYGTMDAIAEALTFQTEGWGRPDLREMLRAEVDELQRLPSDPMASLLAAFPTKTCDRDIMREAILCGADVLLTCDRKFINRGAAIPNPTTKVLPPTELMDRLLELGMHDFWSGGILDHPGCPVAQGNGVAGDLGKLPILLSVLGDD